MQDALCITSNQAMKIIDLITFREDRKNDDLWIKHDDLWERPLVKVNEEQLTIVIDALKMSNLLRSVAKWLEEGGINLGKKDKNNKIGKAFESFVRDELQKHNQLSNVEIYSQNIPFKYKSISFGMVEGDIDVVLRIGNTIIVCETKFLKPPSEPVEIYNFYKTLENAADQAIKGTNYVKEKRDDFLNRTKFLSIEKERVKSLPLIIVPNGSRGTGYKNKNVPVIELDILKAYFASGRLRDLINQRKDERFEKEMIREVYFYFSENEAENLIEDYLAHPPQLTLLFKNIKYKQESINTLYQTIKPAFCRSLFIEIEDID